MQHLMTKALATISATILVTAGADEIKVGFRETAGLHIESGAVEQSDKVVISDGATLVKTGEGSLTVPMDKVDTKTDWQLTVQSGGVTFTGGNEVTTIDGLPAVTSPTIPSVLQNKAIVWLSADTLPEIGSDVYEWKDCRATDETMASYYSATSQYRVATTTTPPVVAETNGVKGVYFGGKSGKYFRFCKGSSLTEISDVRNYFVVSGVYKHWNALLGHSSTSRGYGMSTGVYGTETGVKDSICDFNMYSSARGDFAGRDLSCIHFLDGKHLSPWENRPKTGISLFEGKQLYVGQYFNAIMYNYVETMSTAKAQDAGGDYIFEVVIFTTPLTESERIDVEQYLMNKYALPRQYTQLRDSSRVDPKARPGTGIVKTSANATVTVDVDADKRSTPFAFGGAGNVVKTGEGTLVVGPTLSSLPFSGSFALNEGDVLLKGGISPIFTLGKGETWDATATEHIDEHHSLQSLNSGVLITKSSGEGNVTTKTGQHELRVGYVNGDVKRLKVNAGTLNFSGKEHEAVASASEAIELEVPNHSFEQYFKWTDQYARALSPESVKTSGWNGWYSSGAGNYFQYGTTYSNCTTWTSYPAPDGTNFMMIGYGSVRCWTKVPFPRAGDYEISFYGSSRYSNRLVIDVEFNGRKIGAIRDNRGRMRYYRFNFTVDSSEVGTKDVGFFMRKRVAADDCFLFDDVHIRALPIAANVGAVKVPGGDFEIADSPTAPPVVDYWSSTNMPSGWVVTTNNGYKATSRVNDYVSVVNNFNHDYHNTGGGHIMWLDPVVDGEDGTQALLMYGTPVTVTTAKFTLPKGKWVLHMKAARKPFSISPKGAGELTLEDDPTLSVKVNRADSSVTDLGIVEPYDHIMRSQVAGGVVEVTEEGGEEVSVVLHITNNGVALIDDLEFIPAEGAYDGVEFVRKGNMENPNYNWESISYYGRGPETFNNWGHSHYEYASESWAFGVNVLNGTYCMRLHNNQCLYQTLKQIPCAGLYRLTVHARRRGDEAHDVGNPLVAFTIENGNTNFIFRSAMPRGQDFVEYTRLFRFASGGTKTLYLACEGVKDQIDRSTMLDDISVVKVDESAQSVPIISQNTRITVADGAYLALDYPGEITVKSLVYAGKLYHADEEISASTHPEFVQGIGKIKFSKVSDGITIFIK